MNTNGFVVGCSLPALEMWFMSRWLSKNQNNFGHVVRVENMMKARLLTSVNMWILPKEERELYACRPIRYAGWHKYDENNKTSLYIDVIMPDINDEALLDYVQKKKQDNDSGITMFDAVTHCTNVKRLKVTMSHPNEVIPFIVNVEVLGDIV